MPTMSQNDYVDNFGECCPYCGSGNSVGDSFELRLAGKAEREVTCLSCSKTWIEEYEITGYRVKSPDNQ